MKYFELTFHITPSSETASDVLSALLAEVGFETFVPEADGSLKAYIQQSFYEASVLDEVIEQFPLPDTHIRYTLAEPEDKDWNETWENEGFEPIAIDNRLVVCDTHHEVPDGVPRITIHPRQAFGTGSHQTTRMLLSTLLDMPLKGLRVVDAGCGTGILGFLCLMQGASKLLAYDIDEWSVQNTLDNATLNFSNTDAMEVRLGDASVLQDAHDYDLLIANINRNILLGDMERFAGALKAQGSRILFSGFYQDDVPMLIEKARTFGFHYVCEQHDEEWAMLLLERE